MTSLTTEIHGPKVDQTGQAEYPCSKLVIHVFCSNPERGVMPPHDSLSSVEVAHHLGHKDLTTPSSVITSVAAQ